MLIFYLRKLTSVERSVKADIHLGLSLAFIAGAMNARVVFWLSSNIPRT